MFKKILIFSLILISSSPALAINQGKLINACNVLPRLFQVAAMAALDSSNDKTWLKASYAVGNEIMMTNKEVTSFIQSLRNNKILANHIVNTNLTIDDGGLVNDCVLDPKQRLFTYDRMLKSGKLD